MHSEIICCHSVVPSLISPRGLIIDCGANQGEFAGWASRHTTALVHAFEPDPRLFLQLPSLPRVTYHNYAVAGSAGTMRLNLGEKNCSSLSFSEHAGQESVLVTCVQLPAFLQSLGAGPIDLLKLDIEGMEVDVLDAAPPDFLLSIKQLTVEFHDFLSPQERPKIRRTIARLKNLGFYPIQYSHFSFGDVLFINRRLVPVSIGDKLSLLLSDKYLRGVRRFIRRKILD